MDNIYEQKTIIRKEMLEQRSMLSYKSIQYKNKEILKRFNSLESLNSKKSFMTYVNIGKEVETLGIIKELLEKGKRVSVPFCITKTTELLASQIHNLDELELSTFNLMEPKKDLLRPIDPMDIDIVLVPGLAFDKKGNRLGYGKGYYDRFFSRLNPNALKVGLAYSFQILDKVPVDNHDVPLDMLITEIDIFAIS